MPINARGHQRVPRELQFGHLAFRACRSADLTYSVSIRIRCCFRRRSRYVDDDSILESLEPQKLHDRLTRSPLSIPVAGICQLNWDTAAALPWLR